MNKALTKANEIEAISALAAKTFARVLEVEKRAGQAFLGQHCFKSLEDALAASPEDMSWDAMGYLEEQQPGSFTQLWERIKQ